MFNTGQVFYSSFKKEINEYHQVLGRQPEKLLHWWVGEVRLWRRIVRLG